MHQTSIIRNIISSTNLERIDTKLLLREVLGVSAAKLITLNDYSLTSIEYKKFNLLVKKRLDGVPISYILGKKEFFSRTFKVTANTLTPRPETEILVELVLDLIKSIPKPKLIDLGTGSGCIAITCKLERNEIDVTATDISVEALNVAIENAKNLEVKINFFQNDWLNGVYDYFDVIVSNPPYIASRDKHLHELRHEPLAALTDFADGLSHIRQIVDQSQTCLKSGGYLVLEHGFDQALKVQEIFLDAGFTQVKTIKDYALCDRITYGIHN